MAKKKTAKSKQPTFEQSLAQLESIVTSLEDGQLDLAESLAQYEQGVRHLKLCYTMLNAAERRIELVARVDSEGNPQTEEFDDEASASLDAKGSSPSRRRSAKTARKENRRRANDVDDGSSLF